jgi:SpoVK/Ycf46/Vps4 family AAA+-type ATPase
MNEQKGILSECNLPEKKFTDLYHRIKMPAGIKKRIIAQILLSYTIRGKVPQGALPLHGFILLVGPPGNGKTSLAKGAASVASEMLQRKVRFVQVEPHSLTSGQMGKTQREVHAFLTETIAEYATQGPLIVLLDEVETLAVNRQALSMATRSIFTAPQTRSSPGLIIWPKNFRTCFSSRQAISRRRSMRHCSLAPTR